MTASNLEKQTNPLPWIFGTMIGGILLVAGLSYTMTNRNNTPTNVDKYTVPVTEKTINLEIQASGTVEPIQSVNISPKNPGKLERLLVDQGVIVKKGQPIAVMENQQLYAQGIQAEARVQEAQAGLQEADIKRQGDIQVLSAQLNQALSRLEESKRRIPTQVEQARAQLREAESRLKLAQVQLQRNEALLKEGAITADQFDQLANEVIVSQANVQQIVRRIEELQSTEDPEIKRLEAVAGEIKISLEERQISSKAEIERLKANIKALQANLEVAKIQFQDTFITAPFDGIITQRFATEGAFVTPTTSASNTASATSSSIVALARGLEIVAKVPEIDLNQIKLGQPVQIVADAYPDQVFKGIVKSIAPEAIVEQNVTSFEVKIGILSGQDKLLSKMNVEVNFLGQRRNNVLVLPTVAIVTEKGETGVMIPDENNDPKFKPITIGVSVDDKTEVLSGLLPGDRVFIDLPKDKKKER
ncbi:MAG: efflux RND transporter periplasmic adaptor subunit [Cyanobacteria bacterium]|nr:efflux RND transporter periplasmic adaptor subunit [Cyanobacteria bacterium CG_2015-16_32_12]NCO77085.1 efflux RND transporter periplasmic adaptor subunit [Cyanobacteria bacterium CG_2015-22_32_23]NCQ03762.1 efflux RND transporter periplasmic adaptor subunit [Cyanobacteria bacterium CG_2015-09_32_10]NCQ40766.1 efflux RND transporter periplasmic adaptor subunit [Cyanobacteria bacterium CG_2015-04_32_10]NCS85241.1 efflux RND transporter periplasmic adaptor subunit [Cyanobacteria bacterium CG_2